MPNEECGVEQTLDPQDWEAFRRSAHAALDDALDFTRDVRERPVWQPVPDSVKAALTASLPLEGASFQSVYEDFCNLILPYATGNIHPRFFGWVHGSGTAGGIVAEMMAAAMNSNCGGRDHGGIYVEKQVLNWCKELFEFPAQASGLLVSGTSMANLIALGTARNSISERNIRADGVLSHPNSLIAYASAEAHDSIAKAMEILGLGSAAFHTIPVHFDFSMNVDDLQNAIATDRAAGLQPFCVIGSAGTVNTGAIDDLERLAAICAAESLWFHVDGAFGALCALSERLRNRVRGIERADSIAFDFHKWAHVQYDAGCVLVRRGDLHRAAYTLRPPYLAHAQRGLAGGTDWPCEFGPELSRGFRALKVWFALKEHGTRKLAELIEQNCSQAHYLAQLVAREPDLQLIAPVTLNIVCFRFRARGASPEVEDAINESIVVDLQESGVAAPSTTRLNGRVAIRVNITNHRSRRSDFEVLIREVLRAGGSEAVAHGYPQRENRFGFPAGN